MEPIGGGHPRTTRERTHAMCLTLVQAVEARKAVTGGGHSTIRGAKGALRGRGTRAPSGPAEARNTAMRARGPSVSMRRRDNGGQGRTAVTWGGGRPGGLGNHESHAEVGGPTAPRHQGARRPASVRRQVSRRGLRAVSVRAPCDGILRARPRGARPRTSFQSRALTTAAPFGRDSAEPRHLLSVISRKRI